MGIKRVPTKNAIQTTLDSTFSAGATSAVLADDLSSFLTSVSATNPGVFVVDRIDSSGNATPSKREYCTFTGVSGATLSGVTKNADGGGSDQEHAVGAIVEFLPDVLWAQSIQDTFETEHNADGTHATDAIDAITEIASGLKSGSDTTLITGTAGTTDYTAKWNADGDLVNGYAFLDEDTLSSDSATAVASQQSIKYYADNYAMKDGWVKSDLTFTYSSDPVTWATRVSTSANMSAYLSRGDRLRLKQGGGYLYFYVLDVQTTYIDISNNDDYTCTNTTITDVYFSKMINPDGFPNSFQWSPTTTGLSSVSVSKLYYTINKNNVWCYGNLNGTSDATTFTITLPAYPNNRIATGYFSVPICVYDNGSWQDSPGVIGIYNNTTTAQIGKTMSSVSAGAFGGFLNSGGKGFQGSFGFTIYN